MGEWVTDFIAVEELKKRWKCDSSLILDFYSNIYRTSFSDEEFESCMHSARYPYGEFDVYEIHTTRVSPDGTRYGYASIVNKEYLTPQFLNLDNRHAFSLNIVIRYEQKDPFLGISNEPHQAERGLDPRIKLSLQTLLAAAICRGGGADKLFQRGLAGSLSRWAGLLGREISEDTARRTIKELQDILK